jgi:ribonucleoside-diphosphate reductase subunit M1
VIVNEDGDGCPTFDYKALHKATIILTKNLDTVIDRTYYPIQEAKNSNLKHRPIGVGVQGLADVFFKMMIPYDSRDASELNKKIFETIYHGALTASCELAAKFGPHPSYEGSPMSKGLLQCDLWNVHIVDSLWDWKSLRESIQTHGVRNSLLVAPMPTASTSQILGNTEAFEPVTSNIFVRRTLAGEFTVINKYLIKVLVQRGLWSEALKNKIVENDGSVVGIDEIPHDIQNVFKSAWDMSMRTLIDMAADRGPFVCQSQSLNLFVAKPTYKSLSAMHMYAWKKGLKTGCYYLRIKPAAAACRVTLQTDVHTLKSTGSHGKEEGEEEKSCIMCSG